MGPWSRSRRGVAVLLVATSVVLAATGATPAGAADPEPVTTPRIIGGTTAPAGAHPSVVALLDRTRSSRPAESQFCGGTLVDRSWVLTAAHCLRIPGRWAPSASQVDVLVGTTSLASGGTRIRAAELRVPASWDPASLRNDVALIRLDRPAPAAAVGRIVDQGGAASGDVTAVGWGRNRAYQDTYPTDLLQVSMVAHTDSTCAYYFGPGYSTAANVCSGGGGQGVCFGDSGGPLFQTIDGVATQVGISSFVFTDDAGNGCGAYPSYFTRVGTYATWIRNQVRYGAQPDAASFVRRQHLDLFGRQPSSAELAAGVDALRSRTTTAYVDGLLRGAAFDARTGGVVRLYQAIFLRRPDTEGLMYWKAQVDRGVGLKRIADLMVRAAEFTRLYGPLDDGGFVDLVYDNVLERTPAPEDRAYWVGELRSGRRTRGQVMVGFSESAEYRTTTRTAVTVVAAFAALTRRAPSASELDTWRGRPSDQLTQFLLTSTAYLQRF